MIVLLQGRVCAAAQTQCVGVFWRFKHSMSSGLQFSSPRPVTKTSSHDSAACDSGAAASFSAAAPAAAAVEALLALPAAADAPESDAPILLICAGTPVAVPPH